MDNKKLRSPIGFINPHICPRCGGNFIVKTYEILNSKGTINEEGIGVLDESNKLICVNCDRKYPVEIVKIGSKIIYTLSRESTLENIKKDIEDNDNLTHVSVDNPFYRKES